LRYAQSDYDFKNKTKISDQGGVSTVYKIERRRDKIHYAVKQLNFVINQDTSDEQKEFFTREISTLDDLDHPLVVELVDWFKSDDSKPCIVLEFCEGNLQDMFS
jgi:serine/threonine protein kinase